MTVYLIGSSEHRLVKIGYTGAKAEDRMKDLQTGSPFELRVLDQTPGGKDLEGRAHRRFREYRVKGEWFDFGPGQDPVALFRDFVRSGSTFGPAASSAADPLQQGVQHPCNTPQQGVLQPSGLRIEGEPYKAAAPSSRRARIGRRLDTAGKHFAPLATAWQKAAAKRDLKRTPENLNMLRQAGRVHHETLRGLRQDQRALQKAKSEADGWKAWDGEWRAARAVVRDSKGLVRETAAARRDARRAYPMSLPALAARCHGMHLAPSGVWAAVSDSYAATGVFSLSVAVVALNAVGVHLGSRYLRSTGQAELKPTRDEAALLNCLRPKAWASLAESRGLADVVLISAELTKAGIEAKVMLANLMDLGKLNKMHAQIRAALRLKAGVRLELREAAIGGYAWLTLRTRSAAADEQPKDGASGGTLKALTGWKPGDPWAIDTVTGDPVRFPLGMQSLMTGSSRSGKSWSMRPVLAEASAYDDHRLVVLDPKRVDAECWKHRARVAVSADEILEVTDELVAEFRERLSLVPRGQDTIAISERYPRIMVYVDEGAEVIFLAKDKGKGDDKIEYSRIMDNLRTLSRLASATEIHVLWCTQKATVSGDSPGLDTQISANLVVRASVSLVTQAECKVTFGEDAAEKGWLANELPRPGFALLRADESSKPHHLMTRAFSPQDVVDLPDRPIWSRRGGTGSLTPVQAAERPAEAPLPAGWSASLDEELTEALRPLPGPLSDEDARILAELRADPCRTLASLARATGTDKASVKASLGRMVLDGLVKQDGEGCWFVVE